jgi:uncharacterized membrane protein YccC
MSDDYSSKTTDESLNVDITTMNFLDLRRKRKSYRRIGQRPPEQLSVKITAHSYETIRRLALAEGRRHSPFYEELESLIEHFARTKQELAEKQAFLDMAIADKQRLRKEIEALRAKKALVDITTNNNSPVSFTDESSRNE